MMPFRARSILRRVLAVAAAVALALGLTSVPAVAHEHCGSPAAAHEAMPAMHHAGHGQAAMPGPSIRTAPAGCSHCPPEQCATSEACTGSAVALHATPASHHPPLRKTAIAAAAWRPTASRSAGPPTPPPTPLL